MTQEAIADAVVVAAGSSRRMAGTDKLEIPLAGRSVLRRAVEAMATAPLVRQVIVVCAAERVAELSAAAWLRALSGRVVAGGERRQDSVALGVRATSAGIVLVHDAARPFVSPELVARVVEGVRRHGAAIPVLPVVDALKRVDGERIVGRADRRGLARAQTPQGARRELLLAAIEAHSGEPDEIADEAELLQRHGIEVATVPGEAANLKLTVPEDVALAARLAGESVGRMAVGSDSHPFGPGDGLRLGGLLIEGAPRLHGHSDGDVVLHALADGLLAAAGLGDLGQLFPSGERATRGIDSALLVADVLSRLAGRGLRPATVDVTIVGARPRLGGARLDAMAERLASLLDVDREAVSVKASSGNLAGDEGAGRVISASCLVRVVPA